MEGFSITKLSKILVSHKTLTTFCLNKQKSVTLHILNAELKNSKQIMNTSKGIHTHKRTALAGLLAGVLLTASCSYREEKAVEQSVVGFAQNYFNLRYQKALNACTPESEKWVRFKAPTSRRRMSTYTTLSATQPNVTSSRLIWMTTRQRQ